MEARGWKMEDAVSILYLPSSIFHALSSSCLPGQCLVGGLAHARVGVVVERLQGCRHRWDADVHPDEAANASSPDGRGRITLRRVEQGINDGSVRLRLGGGQPFGSYFPL